MRKKVFFLLLAHILVISDSVYAQQINGLLRPLKPLLGSWEMNSPDGKIIEVWKYDSSGKFSGKSYKVGMNNDSTLLEEVDIIERDGQLYYIPTVSGQNAGLPVEFKLKSRSAGVYVFENKAHDFPQRVCYQLQSSDELLAWIEGGEKRKSAQVRIPVSPHSSLSFSIEKDLVEHSVKENAALVEGGISKL